MKEIQYETIEILYTNKVELQQAAKDGYTQYGMSKMRDIVTLKLRRAIKARK